jgi:hypothetical protein
MTPSTATTRAEGLSDAAFGSGPCPAADTMGDATQRFVIHGHAEGGL